MNVESIAEVKVLTSNYQAEYGRSSGLQITAVTKSGTNRFRGSVYDVERNSDWNANSKTNKLNGDPKTVSKERDWGYSIGGPVGKPGGNNKLFFFYSQEFEPRTGGNDVQRYRVPTALERQGDFSQTTDNIGNLYPSSRTRTSAGACTPTNQTACFADGGVLGRIPGEQALSDRPEHPEACSRCRTSTTCRSARPTTSRSPGRPRSILGWQPARPRRLPADAVAARDVQVLGLAAAQPGHQRHAARLQRHADAAAGRQLPGAVTVNYSLTRRCSSRRPTGAARTSWPAARSRRQSPGRRSAPPPCR